MNHIKWYEIGQSVTENVNDRVWELYHENSKLTRYNNNITMDEIREKTKKLLVSQSFKQFKTTQLPKPDFSISEKSLWNIMTNRITTRNLSPKFISLQELSNILFCGYGITRLNENNDFPHPFRTVPSAGGLFPLEIYFHQNYVKDLEVGLYHYNVEDHSISLIKKNDQTRKIGEILVQPELAIKSSVIFFISALFERSSFKYGERSYRFTFLEAGHVAQNINLAANGHNLGAVNIGGFLDRKTDAILELDGVDASCIYLVAIGENQD